jgi:hypothetical protein
MRSLSVVTVTWWGGGTQVAIFRLSRLRLILRPMSKPGGALPARYSIHTAAYGRALVMLVAGLALCYGESNNLTWLGLMAF